MRRLLLTLIAISLSWVTMGYTCSMSGEVAQLACCCDAGAAHACPELLRNCSSDSMRAGSRDTCCSIVVSAGSLAQGSAENVGPQDLSLLSTLPIQTVAEWLPARLFSPAHPLIAARRAASTPIYLIMGRLLR